jgi:hypothetical protein
VSPNKLRWNLAEVQVRSIRCYFVLSVRDRLKLQDAVDVNNGRSINANETPRVQILSELIYGGAVEQLLACTMQIDVDPCILSSSGPVLEHPDVMLMDSTKTPNA